MQVSHFKSAHKIITGYGAVSQIKEQITHLGITQPFIITDQGVVQSGTLKTVTQYLSDFNLGIYDQVKPEPEPEIVLECSHQFRGGSLRRYYSRRRWQRDRYCKVCCCL